MLQQTGQNQEAILHYDTPDFVVMRMGGFVRCAVTGTPIELDDLRYWSPDAQEAYINGTVAVRRMLELKIIATIDGLAADLA